MSSFRSTLSALADNLASLAVIVLLAGLINACRSSEFVIPPSPTNRTIPVSDSATSLFSRDLVSSFVDFSQLSLEDGLSQSTVTTIFQDSKGLIWLGTRDGLNRYNGYQITTFKNDPLEQLSISGNKITSVVEDLEGYLWIGTDGDGLNRFDPNLEQFRQYRHDPSNPTSLQSNTIHALMVDDLGNIWIGSDKGIERVKVGEGERVSFVEVFETQPHTQGKPVKVIFQARDGLIWFGTTETVSSFDPDTSSTRSFRLLTDISATVSGENLPVSINDIVDDESGNIWIGTRGEGLFNIEPKDKKITIFRHNQEQERGLSSNYVRSLVVDSTNTLWIGTSHGLDRLGPDDREFTHFHHNPQDQKSLSDDDVHKLFIDQAGVLWVGTNLGGANIFDPFKKKFRHIFPDGEDPDKLSHHQVWAIFEEGQDIWIGTAAGLDRINTGTGSISHFLHDPTDDASISNNFITHILKDQEGYYWISTRGGLNRFDPKKNQFERFLNNPDDPTSISSNDVNTIYLDSFGRLWVGTNGAGIDRSNLMIDTFSHYLYQEYGGSDESLSINSILCFYEDDDNQLWVGTEGGLLKYDPITGSFTIYRHSNHNPSSLGNQVVNDIHQDNNGYIWLATENGLDKFDPRSEQFAHFRESNGLPNNNIQAIVEDESGDLWISTNRGLSRFNSEEESFRNYDTVDGLQSLEFNRGAAYHGPDGIVYFGGINGFNVFYPDEIRDNTYSPPIIINQFFIHNEPVEIGPDSPLSKVVNSTKQIQLSRDINVFSFELASLHYGSPAENQYAYLMEGFDREWNLVGNRRIATYTNLPPGSYTFRAIGTNSDGIWSNESTKIDVIIPYPFWQTWWFALGIFFVIVGALLGGYWMRTRNTVLRTKALEEQVARRTVEIERRRQIAEGLREIMVLINSNKTLEESLHYIVSQAARLTEAEDAIIFRKGEEDTMTILATNPGGQIRYSPNVGLAAITESWAESGLMINNPLILPDLNAYWRANPNLSSGSVGTHKAMLGIPILVEEEIYGGLIMLYDHQRAFVDEDLDLGFTFADQATLAIANNHLRKQAEQIAVATERSRLARDLHDAVTQTIFSASLIAETVPAIWANDKEEGEFLLQDLRQLTRGALAEMRTLLLELRPAALEEAALSDLLNQLAEAVGGRTGIDVVVKTEDGYELPVSSKVALYRIAQESLNNIIKHARASMVELSLTYPEDFCVELTIRDDGLGFDLNNIPADRLGLRSMRERADSIGATLAIRSVLNQGTEVSVKLYTEH